LYIYDHGGDIAAEKDSVTDFSVNINPLGMPDSCKAGRSGGRRACEAYPDHSCRRLRQAISGRFGTDPDAVICGNGASDLIYRLFAALKPRLPCWPLRPFRNTKKRRCSRRPDQKTPSEPTQFFFGYGEHSRKHNIGGQADISLQPQQSHRQTDKP
jgi:hypothetical protein